MGEFGAGWRLNGKCSNNGLTRIPPKKKTADASGADKQDAFPSQTAGAKQAAKSIQTICKNHVLKP
jgi:hypothetical protein